VPYAGQQDLGLIFFMLQDLDNIKIQVPSECFGAFIGVLECAFMKDVPGTGNKFVGDFRNGYIDFGWDTFSKEEKLSKRPTELNNGRAAQM
jgi:Chlorophyll A-B binding protein